MNDCNFGLRRREQELEHPDRAIRRYARGVAVELKHPRHWVRFQGRSPCVEFLFLSPAPSRLR
jgi:hypothetical protein